MGVLGYGFGIWWGVLVVFVFFLFFVIITRLLFFVGLFRLFVVFGFVIVCLFVCCGFGRFGFYGL